jgi:hypothetical protein
MARATFVKSARKDYPDHGIKKGESYYWWKFRTGGRGGPKRFSKTLPRASQLTQSDFYSQLYRIQEDIEDWTTNPPEDLAAEVSNVCDELRSLGQEQQDKYDNMPEGLQQGDTGQLLEGRNQACEDYASEIEAVDLPEKDDGETQEESDQRVCEAIEQLQGVEFQDP